MRRHPIFQTPHVMKRITAREYFLDTVLADRVSYRWCSVRRCHAAQDNYFQSHIRMYDERDCEIFALKTKSLYCLWISLMTLDSVHSTKLTPTTVQVIFVVLVCRVFKGCGLKSWKVFPTYNWESLLIIDQEYSGVSQIPLL
jgi:hypothetical protein